MTLSDFVYSSYASLLDAGWRMNEIDSMDMIGFLRIRAYQAKKKQPKPEQKYIDDIWPT